MQSLLVDAHIHFESSIFHGVGGEMLDARHGVALYPTGERRSETANVMGVFALGLLGASPGWMAQDVDTYPAVQVGPHRRTSRPMASSGN